MTSATFFSTRWPATTFGPGLHNLELHAQSSSCARGWSASRAALFLQSMYRYLPTEDADVQSLLPLNGDVYRLCKGWSLSIFLDESEAKYREFTVIATWAVGEENMNNVVLNGDCEEELVPGSQNCGNAMQFAWALRWMFAKSSKGRTGRKYDCLLSEVD